MAEEITQTSEAGKQAAADGLRDVPSDISEYEKFTAEGGHEHNEKLINRDKAIADAKAAGILPENPDAEAEAQEQLPRRYKDWKRTVNRLQRKIGAQTQKISDLEARSQAGAIPAAAPNGTRETQQAAPAADASGADKPRVNGKHEPPPRPKEDDFKTYGEFIEALTDWKTDRKLEAAEERKQQAQAERAEADKGRTITEAHNARVDEAKTRYPDWGTAFQGLNDNSFTEPMVVFIFESDRGPDVTYYLAKHRDELARIAALSPIRQASELGKIEARVQAESPREQDDEEGDEDETLPAAAPAKPPEKRSTHASKAPPPAKPIGGASGKGADDMPDPSDFQAYEVWSRRQAAKGAKR